MKNILTIDVEAWFNQCGIEDSHPVSTWAELDDRMEESLQAVLDLLAEYGAGATFFFMGYWAKQKPNLVRMALERGHTIGCHGNYHRRVYDLGEKGFDEDLREALSILEEVSGSKIVSYRAPEWSIRKDSSWALDKLAEKGIRFDSSMMPVSGLGDPEMNPLPHKIKTGHGEVVEIPPTILETPAGKIPVSGGLFFRAVPYSMIKKRIQSLNKEGHPAVIYVHPWEMIPDHPRLKLYTLRGFFHYTMLGKAKSRLCSMLSDFEFCGIEEWFRESEI